EWRTSVTYKLSYYLAMTYFYCGITAEDNKKRGEAVCYYEAAVERLKEAWKNAAKISNDKVQPFQESCTFTTDVLVGKYKSAKRDNDSVFFEKVPTLSSLTAVQGAIVAKPQSFDFQDPDVCGPDIFQRLVPMDTHFAASEYSEEKAKLLREVVELVENKNRELETFLLCLQMDRVPLDQEYLRLPRDLLDCCAAVGSRPSMPKDLALLMQQLNSLHHDLEEQSTDFEQNLQNFEENGNDLVKQNKELKNLQLNVKTTIDSLARANENNAELHKRMVTLSEHLKLLGSPLDQLMKTLPTIAELDDENNKPKISRLKTLVEKVDVMRKQREQLMNDFRKRIQDDDITTLVIMHRQDSHKNLFMEQLKKHEELVNIIKQNCTAQANILQMLTEANADFAEVRSKIAAKSETYVLFYFVCFFILVSDSNNHIVLCCSRTKLINDYIHSFKSFPEVTTKANEGIEFYKKLAGNLEKLNERFSALQQIMQKQQSPITPSRIQLPRTSVPARTNQEIIDGEFRSISPLTPVSPSISTLPDRPRLKDYLAVMKPETWGKSNTGRRKQLPASDRTYALQDASIPSTNYYETQQPQLQQHPSLDYPFTPQNQPERSQGITSTARSQSNTVQQQPQWQHQLPSPNTTKTFHLNSTSHQPNVNQYEQSQSSFIPQTNMSQSQFQQPQQNFIQQPPHANNNPIHLQPQFNQYADQQPAPFIHQQPHIKQESLYSQYPPSAQQQQHFTPSSTVQYQPVSPIVPTHHPQQVIAPTHHPQQVIAPTHHSQQAIAPTHHPQQVIAPMFQQPFSSINNPPTSQYTMPISMPPESSHQQQYQPVSNPTSQPKFDPYRPQPVGSYEIPKSQTYQPQSHVSSTVQYPMQSQQPEQNVNRIPGIKPEDVYRPSVFPPSSSGMLPSSSVNNNSSFPNNTNQFVQYPQQYYSTQPQSQPPSGFYTYNNNNDTNFNAVLPSSSTNVVPHMSNLSINSNQYSNVSKTNKNELSDTQFKIADDLLSLDMNEQISSPVLPSSTATIAETSQIPNDVDTSYIKQIQINGKPTACIQPWSTESTIEHPLIVSESSPQNEKVSSSITTQQDPYDDKDKLDQLVTDVCRFEKQVDQLTKKTLNGTIPLEIEWKELADFQEKDVSSFTSATGKCYPNKNRYQDVLPCMRIRDNGPCFISAQYPLSNSISDFWTMICEQQIAIVVVLLRLEEIDKNVCPQKVGEEIKLKFITISLLSTKNTQYSQHKIIRIQNSQTNQSRTVIWLEHVDWPIKEMPDNPSEFLRFIKEVQYFLLQTRNTRSTILVTCLNSVSRTGAFLVLFTCIQDIDEGGVLTNSSTTHMLNKETKTQHYSPTNFILGQTPISEMQALLEKARQKSTIITTTTVISPGEQDNGKNSDKSGQISEVNYDIGPVRDETSIDHISSNITNDTVSEENHSLNETSSTQDRTTRLLTSIEENFNLRPEESCIRQHITKDDFRRQSSSLNKKDLADPFNQLDSLWTFKKKI
ncbi:unnamed protein product, partial [Didymodactylos carnosus]